MKLDIKKDLEDLTKKFADPSKVEELKGKGADDVLLLEYRERLDLEAKFWKEADAEDLASIDASVKKALSESNERVFEIEPKIVEAKDLKTARQMNDLRRRALDQVGNDLPNPHGDEGETKARGRRLLSDPVMEDAEFKGWLQKVAKLIDSRVQFGQSPSVETKALITGTSATSGGALVVNDRLAISDPGTFMRPLTIRDLITTGRTGSDLVEFVRQTSLTNAAAPVVEATATTGASGQKPESDFALEVVQATVKTIAHWVAATRRALGDAPQLRTWIDNLLRYGLDEELNDQIVNGAGTGENFTGLLNTTGTQSQAYDTGLIVTARKARTKVRIGGRTSPTAYLFNPADWEQFDLLQDGENRYYFGGPSILGNPRLWGLPVVEEEAVPSGVGLVGDFKLAFLWDRELANILISDSHNDFFTRNMIAILAELRAAFGVIRPAAFVEIDLTEA